MSEVEQAQQVDHDGAADALATIVIIAIVVCTAVYWLHSM